MINTFLGNFVERTSQKKRICFGDVKRLSRDILPDGIATREEADVLIGLDRAVSRVDPAWSNWLVAAMVDFVVWGARPTGTVDADTARWLAGALSGDDGLSKRAALIVREILREAEAVDDALACLVTRKSKRRAGVVEAEAAQAPLAA